MILFEQAFAIELINFDNSDNFIFKIDNFRFKIIRNVSVLLIILFAVSFLSDVMAESDLQPLRASSPTQDQCVRDHPSFYAENSLFDQHLAILPLEGNANFSK